MEATLVLALGISDRSAFSAEEADLSMKSLKSRIASPSCNPLVSHAHLKLHKNLTIKIGLFGSKAWCFISAVVRFDILLIPSICILIETFCSRQPFESGCSPYEWLQGHRHYVRYDAYVYRPDQMIWILSYLMRYYTLLWRPKIWEMTGQQPSLSLK